MNYNKIATLFVILAVGLQACSITRPVVIGDDSTYKNYSFKLVDERTKEIRKSFITKAGFIYSCHYGIILLEDKDIVPDRLVYLSNKLESLASEHLNGKTFLVQRFTIFWNNQFGLRSAVMAGVSGGFAATGDILSGVVIWGGDVLLRDAGSLVGCEENYTGAYFTNELNGGHSPIVLYFDGKIDDIPIRLRIVQPAGKDMPYKDLVQSSIDLVVKAIISKLKNET